MNSEKFIRFIVNPASGHQSRKPDHPMVEAFFRNSGIRAELCISEDRSQGTVLAEEAVKMGAMAVVAAGGDGTVNEIASVLNQTSCALGIIPCGSGNGLARHHKIPMNIAGALGVIKRFNTVQHDAVRINGRLSFNVSGIGFDAHVAHQFGLDGKRGFAGYVKLVIREFSSYGEFPVSITNGVGESTTARVMLVAIANGSQFGNNATIAPFASTHDGLTDLTLVRRVNTFQMAKLAWDVLMQRVSRSKYVRMMQSDSFLIAMENELPLHVDGEPSGHARQFRVETLKGTLKMIVP